MAKRPPKRKRLSPREKKDLSLAKDRRADWWEYERKGVRSKHRARSHRTARRENPRELIENPDIAEAKFLIKQKARWRKISGVTLAVHIAHNKEKRKAMHSARILRKKRYLTGPDWL